MELKIITITTMYPRYIVAIVNKVSTTNVNTIPSD